MIRTLVIPGFRGSEEGHWQRHFVRDHPAAEVVEQEDFDRPVLSEWLHRLEARLAATPDAVLVAHSLGCALVAHLAGRPSSAHVAGALLVAPADVDALRRKDPLFAGFAPMPTAPLPFPSILVASRNDPFMRFGQARALARSWQAGFIDLGAAGHINVASGHGPWPEAVVLAESLRSRRAARAADQALAPRPAGRRRPLPTAVHSPSLGARIAG